SSVSENQTMNFSGSFTDPDTGETHKVTIVWGDGTANTVINNIAAGTFTFATTHKYLDDNPTSTSSDVYNISVTVADGPGAVSTAATTSVTVNNVAPVITTTAANLSLPVSINFTDAGTKDTHTATIN